MANGNIDQLNFEVILDDKKFNQQIERDLKAASELNTKLSSVLNMKKRLNKETTEQIINAERARQAEQKTAQEMAKTALAQEKVRTQAEKTAAAQRMHTGAVAQTNATLLNTTSIMRTLSQLTGATFSIIGVRRFLSSLIDITGQFEVQKMSLRNMLQDVSAADRIFRQLYDFSTESTYRFSELAKYSKQLAGFQIGKDDLLETTKMLGDVASGLGVSMDRLILAYGHVKSSGFLRGIQLRSFSQNGVPILKELSDMFTEIEGKAVSMGDVFDKMTKREIPFEMVAEAFRRMTSEGGQFYRMQEVLAKTLAGQINILKGKWENAMYAIGESNDKWLKGGVQILTSMVNHIQEIGAALKPVIAGFGAYGAALAVAQMGTWIVGAARAVTIFIQLARATSLATAMVTAFGTATKAVAASLGVLSALTVVVVSMVQATGRAKRELDEFNHSLDEIHKTARDTSAYDAEISKIDSLRKIVDNANNSYDARKAALDQLKQIVPDYHANLTEEGRLINNNKAALDKYIEALNREAKMKGAQDELAKLYKKRREVEKEVESAQKNVDVATSAPVSTTAATSTGYAFVAVAQSSAKANRELGIAKQKLQSIDNQIDSINKELAETIGHVGPESPGQYNVASIIEGIKKYDADIKKIRDLAKKGTISAEQKDALDSLIAQREEQAKLYEDIMGVKYDKDNKAKRGGASDPNATARQSLQADIRVLEKYKSAYDKLEPIFGSQTAPQLEKIFGKVTDFNNLDAAIEKLIADLRDLGDDKSRDAAESIEASLGLDDVSKAVNQYNEAEKALKAYERALEKFDKDWGSGDTSGASYKAEGVLKKYTNEKKKIEDEWKEFTDAAVKANKKVEQSERDLYEARKRANENKMEEGLRGLVDDIFKEKFNGKELSDWSHKSLADIAGIKKAVETMELPDDIKAMVLEKGGEGALKELQKAFNEYRQNLITGTIDPELFKKSSKYAKSLASYISKAGDAMERLGAATNNAGLSDAGQAISAIGQNLNAAAEGYEKSGSWIGAVVGGVVDIFNQVVDATGRANEKMREMEDAVRRIRSEAESVRFNDFLSDSVDGIFGDNHVRRIKNAIDAVRIFGKDANDVYDSLFRKSREVMDADTSRALAALNGFTIYDSNDSPWGAVNRIMVKTAKEWAGGEYKSLEKLANDLNLELFDNNGFLNPVLLDKVINEYGDLNHELTNLFTEAKQQAEAYAQAMKQIEDATKDIFDNLASDMADQFIDNFLAMGNAVDDLSGTFANLGDAILRSFLQSYVLDEILKNYEEQATDALKKYSTGQMTPDEYAAWLNGFAQNVQQEAETLAPAINGMIEAFKDRGLMNIDESTANSVGAGIKGITEDTANLLASYINAIRADVSYMRVMQEKGWSDVAAIAGAVASPTLNDYVAQIAASNYDIAQSNQRILSELQSVIGAPGTSGMVVRVESN